MSKKSFWGKAMGIFVEDANPTPSEPESEVDFDPEDLDNTDIEALLARTRSMTTSVDTTPDAPEPVPTPTPHIPTTPSIPTPAVSIIEGRDFTEVYQEMACVPPAPQPVEVVMNFLKGLQAMPAEVQRASLVALDEAHPDWTITDVVLDAKNKIEALRRAKVGLGNKLQAIQTQTQAELASFDAKVAETNATIDGEINTLRVQADAESSAVDEQITLLRQQISALEEKKSSDTEALNGQIAQMESLREQEASTAEAAKEAVRANLTTATEACGREAARYDAHATSLQKFIIAFGPSAQGDAS